MAALTALITESGGCIGALGDGNVDRAPAVDVRVGGDEVGAVFDGADVAQVDAWCPRRGGWACSRSSGRLPPRAALVRAMRLSVPVGDIARRHHEARLGDGGDGFVGRDAVLLELVGIERDDDGALVAAERGRRGNAGQSGEQRTHAVEREILHFALGSGGAAEDQLADGDAAGVEARDERRHGSRGHEGAGAVHVADGFRHRLAQVGALVKYQLHERGALNALALDVIDAGDVEEVILVVIGEVAFHLRGVHAAIGLGHVDCGVADLREDIDGHALESEHGAEGDGDQRHDYGHRSAEGCQDEAHDGLPAGLARRRAEYLRRPRPRRAIRARRRGGRGRRRFRTA